MNVLGQEFPLCLGAYDARAWVDDINRGALHTPCTYHAGWLTPDGRVLAFKFHHDAAHQPWTEGAVDRAINAYERMFGLGCVRVVLYPPHGSHSEVSFGVHGDHPITQAQLRSMIALQFVRTTNSDGWLEDYKYDPDYEPKLVRESYRDARTLVEAIRPYLEERQAA